MKYKKCPHCGGQLISPLTKKRKELGKTLEEIAEFVGAKKQSVHQWEIGNNKPSLGKVPITAKAYEMDAAEFLNAILWLDGNYNSIDDYVVDPGMSVDESEG